MYSLKKCLSNLVSRSITPRPRSRIASHAPNTIPMRIMTIYTHPPARVHFSLSLLSNQALQIYANECRTPSLCLRRSEKKMKVRSRGYLRLETNKKLSLDDAKQTLLIPHAASDPHEGNIEKRLSLMLAQSVSQSVLALGFSSPPVCTCSMVWRPPAHSSAPRLISSLYGWNVVSTTQADSSTSLPRPCPYLSPVLSLPVQPDCRP